MSSSSNNTNNNKALVKTAFEEMLIKKDLVSIDRNFSADYIQHNPLAPNGLGPLKNWLVGAVSSFSNHRALIDGDLVVLHNRYVGLSPTVNKGTIAFDIFRIDPSTKLIAEHWDVCQDEEETTASGRTQLDGPTEPKDLHLTEQNRALIKDFAEAILVKGQGERVTEFISTETYHQHNPHVADGLAGFGQAMEAMAKAGFVMKYHKVHRIVVEGDLAFLHSEGEFMGKHVAFADIFRIEGGKIVEHWDCIQEVPKEAANTNTMF